MGAKQANERQFDEIYRTHRDDLFRLGLLICGDRARSEDAVAEVFAKVLPRWRAGTVLDHPASYLRRAVERRVAAKQWGDDRGRPQLDAEISEHEQMRAALMLLPTSQRAVLVLRYYADLTEAEIADLLQISPGTVKSRAARAMTRLRELFELEGAFGPEASQAPLVLGIGWERVQRWVQFDEEGHPAAIIDLQWGPGPSQTDDPLEPFRDDPSQEIVGSNFLHSVDDGWIVGLTDGTDLASAGRVVRLSGIVAPEDAAPDRQQTPLADGVLLQVLDELVVGPEGGLVVDDPPDGFELVGEWPGQPHAGDAARGLHYTGPAGRSIDVWMADDSEVPLAASLGTSAARRLQVRDQVAVSTPFPAMRPAPHDDPLRFLDGDARFLEWTEPSGERVVIAGLGLTEADLLAIAGTLDPVDAATWFELQGRPVPDVKDQAVDPSTTSSTTSVGPSGEILTETAIEHMEGTYEGRDEYRFTEGRCDLTPEDTITLSSTDGSQWDLVYHQCAEVTSDTWSAVGTFVLTAGDGATLTGTSDQGDIPLPTTGEPFELTITGGTGRYDDATGACLLDNHITGSSFGAQLLDGTFTCDFIP